MSNNRELTQRCSQAIPRGIGQICPISADRAENYRMQDIEGRECLGFAGGIVVFNTRYLHPKVVVAVEAQLKKLLHTCLQVLACESYPELCRIMNRKMPDDFTEKTLLVTVNSEAVEDAVKIVHATTKRGGTITFSGAHHGRTHYILMLTGKVNPYSAGMGLTPGHAYRASYPCPLHDINRDDVIVSIHRIFKNDAAPEDIAAIVIEPVRDESGFYAMTPTFVQHSRALYDEHGIMLVVDKVQSDVGRTGTLFAMEQMGVVPDLTTLTKSIAGSPPLAGVAGRVEVMGTAVPGGLGGTYVDNLIVCVAALGMLKVFEQENLLQKTNDLGQKLKDRLLAIAEKHTEIDDIRRPGAMITIELFEDGDHSEPDAKFTAKIAAHIRDRDLILLSYGPCNNVLRVLAPLTIENVQICQGLEAISQCFAEAKQQICTHARGDTTRLVWPTRIQVG